MHKIIPFRENNYHPNFPDRNLHLQTFSEKFDWSNFQNAIFFKNINTSEKKCIEIVEKADNTYLLHTSYFIGIDWLNKNKDVAVYVEPKPDSDDIKIDYMQMLISCIRNSEVASHMKNLYEIKFNEGFIEIEHRKDLLTPLLVVHFLNLLKIIVRKGLKKSYYKIERNLNSKIKGKVNISQTIKENILKNKPLKTVCQYNEFGFNNIENRLLKHTLLFVKKYLSIFPNFSAFSKDIMPIFNYCLPAFHEVDENIEIKSIKGLKTNVFYKEYSEAIRLANLILKRFQYNIKNIEDQSKKVKIPPYWIDMAELFERYCEIKLRKIFEPEDIKVGYSYGEGNDIRSSIGSIRPDFIVKGIVIDAKYRLLYLNGWDKDNMAQLSLYSRNKEIRARASLQNNEEPKIVFLYPSISSKEDCSIDDIQTLDKLGKDYKSEDFYETYKIPIQLPVIKNT